MDKDQVVKEGYSVQIRYVDSNGKWIYMDDDGNRYYAETGELYVSPYYSVNADDDLTDEQYLQGLEDFRKTDEYKEIMRTIGDFRDL